ncbi:MAG: bacterioferritin [Aphanocapsa feldmannii 277cV]|uniref:Bacterioferritin n=2 Tax=Aphanocapsa feldmannii TaxID=192050 RepID=A0A524RKE2_9CHRO|nr:MAG: bacterioferritin [Aphanocapsa feldmannii 288cV]TGG89963.1 MAG: bacterioferritin [Aphanocapsa feldmannii 277cV]TGH23554.1 MAG: bacterioferritin [Aphanocapsa feldmannii 277cI]
MNGLNPRVLAYLGRALSLELSAVQQYMTQACLVGLWGETEAADRFRQETLEEMGHAERIVQQMLRLRVAPSASQLQPVTTASDLRGLLAGNAVLEQSLISHYDGATRFCHHIGDSENAAFFQSLLEEEQHHGQELAEWLHSLDPQNQPQPARATF